MLSVQLLVLLAPWILVQKVQAEEETVEKKKPFGLGQGPAFIGGSDVRSTGTKLMARIFGQYRNYRVLTGDMQTEEVEYNQKWAERDLCEDGCNAQSECLNGICACKKDYLQIFGQCFDAGWVAFGARDDTHKYRKPPDPVKPETCFEYYYDRDSNDKKVKKKRVKESMLNVKACQTPPFIRHFDPAEQNCTFVKPCNEKGVNLLCDRNIDRCKCRTGTEWNPRTMECQVFLDVDCQSFSAKDSPNKDIMDFLNSTKVDQSKVDNKWTKDDIKKAFCFLLEEEAEEYLANQVDESDFYILGLSIGAFFATCIGSICGACCCCQCCASVREKIRNLDPRYRMRNMDQNTQMAALAAIGASEMLDKRDDQNDEFKAAQLQGTLPPAPAGYAPVPNPSAAVYPPGQGGYAGYPPPAGQQPVPGAVYPPGQPVYPPGQPVPQPASGLMSYVPSVAPEAIMAGVGAYQGNKEMMGLGVLGMVDKMNAEEEKDERIKAATIKGVPPPPMGYAGGPPVNPGGGNPVPDHLAQANYPRQS